MGIDIKLYGVLGGIILISLIEFVFIIKMRRSIKIKNTELNTFKLSYIDSNKNVLLSKILKSSAKNEEDLSKSCMVIVDTLIESYNIDYCSILLSNEKGSHKVIASNISSPKIRKRLEEFSNKELRGFDAIDGGIVYSTNNGILEYDFCRGRGVSYYFLMPLEISGEVIGSLIIENCSTVNVADFEEDFFSIVVENIAIVLQNFIYYDKVVSLAMRDGLTGAFNRNYMNKFLDSVIKRASTNDAVFSVAIFDIDHFKKFNDTYGHLFGDLVLKKLVEFFNNNMKDGEVLFRYGGEEFVMFFPNASSSEVYQRLDTLRILLSQYEMADDRTTTTITSSFGLAEYPANGLVAKKLIENADKALYHSKENGRNRVTSFNDISAHS